MSCETECDVQLFRACERRPVCGRLCPVSDVPRLRVCRPGGDAQTLFSLSKRDTLLPGEPHLRGLEGGGLHRAGSQDTHGARGRLAARERLPGQRGGDDGPSDGSAMEIQRH